VLAAAGATPGCDPDPGARLKLHRVISVSPQARRCDKPCLAITSATISRFTAGRIRLVYGFSVAGCRERRHGISDATFYTWRSKYGGLEISEVRRVRQLEEEIGVPPRRSRVRTTRCA